MADDRDGAPEVAPGAADAVPVLDDGADAAEADPRARARVVRDGLAVGLATAAYGISFGALAVAAGLDVWQACVLSLVMFTGGSQFALVGVIAAGGAAAGPAAVASSVMLGLRNVVYGMRMAPIVRATGWRRVVAPWWTIDESVAVALAQRVPALQRVGFWATGAAIYVGWNLTTLLGALIGDALGDTSAWGLDAAAAAAFLGLLWPRLKSVQAGAVAAAAAVVAALVTPVLAPGLPVLVAAVVAVVVGWWNLFGRRREPEVPA